MGQRARRGPWAVGEREQLAGTGHSSRNLDLGQPAKPGPHAATLSSAPCAEAQPRTLAAVPERRCRWAAPAVRSAALVLVSNGVGPGRDGSSRTVLSLAFARSGKRFTD